MYKDSSTLFNENIIQPGRTFAAKMVCGDDEINSFLSLKTTNQSVVNNDAFDIGGTVSCQLDISCEKPNFIISNREFQLLLGILINDEIEYIPIGLFTAQKPTETDDGIITFTSFDRMVSKFNKPYFSDITSYPTDAKNILAEIQSKTGIKINMSNLSSGIMVDYRTDITSNEDGEEVSSKTKPFDGYTYREAIGYIAQLYGMFATINRVGDVDLRWYTSQEYIVSADMSFDDIECAELEYEVEKIDCSTNTETLTVGTGTVGISISNPIMTQRTLDDVFNSIGHFKYIPTTFSCLGDPRLDLGDIVSVEKRDGTLINVPIMVLSLDYDGGLTANIGSYGSTEQSESVQKGPTAQAMDRVYTELLYVKEILADKVSIGTLEADYATIKQLEATNASIGNLSAIAITTDNLEANVGKFGYITSNEAEIVYAKISELNAITGNINDLTVGVERVNTLMFGSATGTSLTTEFSNTIVGLIGDAQIKSAMIDSLDVEKVNSGTISTNKFTIASDSGNMIISDNTMQISDGTQVRVQVGKDAGGDYNIYIWDSDGKLMFDATGITEDAIQRAIIRDDMVSDNANISAKKLDISSLFSEINGSTETIKASHIYIDADSQTLDILFQSMKNDVREMSETVSAQGTEISTIQGQISSKIWKQDIQESTNPLEARLTTQENNYSTLEQDLNGFKTSVSNNYYTKNEINNIEIGAKNLLKNSIDLDGDFWSTGYYITDENGDILTSEDTAMIGGW